MNDVDRAVLRETLKVAEGRRLKPYYDTAQPPRLTVGYGRNLSDVGISPAEAVFLLDNDIDRAIADCERGFPSFAALNPVRQRAIAEMCFNVGLGRLLGFKQMVDAVRAGDHARVAAEMLDSKWARQVGERSIRIADMYRAGRDPY